MNGGNLVFQSRKNRISEFRQNRGLRCPVSYQTEVRSEERRQGEKKKLSSVAGTASVFSGKPLHPQVNLAQWLWKTEALAASQDDSDGSF